VQHQILRLEANRSLNPSAFDFNPLRGLAKVCARLEVPVPPHGHWAKLQAGKPVSKVPLPAPRPMTPQETAIQRTLGSQLLPEPPASRDPELQARINAALASAQAVRVPRSLSNPHPLIGKWMDEDRRAQKRIRESFYAPAHLSITRTETDWRRLRILTSLFREFERIGHGLTAARERRSPIVIRSKSAHLEFVLIEPIRRVRLRASTFIVCSRPTRSKRSSCESRTQELRRKAPAATLGLPDGFEHSMSPSQALELLLARRREA
jgi:hypothetical protein